MLLYEWQEFLVSLHFLVTISPGIPVIHPKVFVVFNFWGLFVVPKSSRRRENEPVSGLETLQ